MNIIVCVDDKNGMMFNKRRQSRDRVLIQDVLKEVGENLLWMNEYSAKQFTDCKVNVSEDFMNLAKPGEYCFVENISLEEYENEIERIILYHWNRNYPADFYFTIDVTTTLWQSVKVEEFAGSSHEKITKEIFERKQS